MYTDERKKLLKEFASDKDAIEIYCTDNELMSKLGDAIRQRRRELGLGVIKVASYVGVTPVLLQNFEAGLLMPASWVLTRISKILAYDFSQYTNDDHTTTTTDSVVAEGNYNTTELYSLFRIWISPLNNKDDIFCVDVRNQKEALLVQNVIKTYEEFLQSKDRKDKEKWISGIAVKDKEGNWVSAPKLPLYSN